MFHIIIYYQLLSSNEERVSANPSPDAVIGPPKDVLEQPEASETGELNTIHQHNAYASHEQILPSYGESLLNNCWLN